MFADAVGHVADQLICSCLNEIFSEFGEVKHSLSKSKVTSSLVLPSHCYFYCSLGYIIIGEISQSRVAYLHII